MSTESLTYLKMSMNWYFEFGEREHSVQFDMVKCFLVLLC